MSDVMTSSNSVGKDSMSAKDYKLLKPAISDQLKISHISCNLEQKNSFRILALSYITQWSQDLSKWWLKSKSLVVELIKLEQFCMLIPAGPE